MDRSEPVECQVVEAPHGEPLYQRMVILRDAVLRKPLGLAFTPEQLAAEHSDLHFAVLSADEQVIGTVIASPRGSDSYQLRQMAIDDSYRGRGIGAKLLRAVESQLTERGTRELHLHARDHAVGFYAKQGYQAVGEEFVEVGIAHRRMTKRLD